jgi:enoyl-CoA hydratase/carnithine racemase
MLFPPGPLLDPAPKLWHHHGDCQSGGNDMAELIKVTVQDHIATVVMDRPPVNAQNTAFREELIAAFDAFTDRDDVRVAILTGFGKMF